MKTFECGEMYPHIWELKKKRFAKMEFISESFIYYELPPIHKE